MTDTNRTNEWLTRIYLMIGVDRLSISRLFSLKWNSDSIPYVLYVCISLMFISVRLSFIFLRSSFCLMCIQVVSFCLTMILRLILLDVYFLKFRKFVGKSVIHRYINRNWVDRSHKTLWMFQIKNILKVDRRWTILCGSSCF